MFPTFEKNILRSLYFHLQIFLKSIDTQLKLTIFVYRHSDQDHYDVRSAIIQEKSIKKGRNDRSLSSYEINTIRNSENIMQ